MRILVTGAAGFLGSHLCRRLVTDGHKVVGMDSLLTGTLSNIEDLFTHDTFTFVKHDVTEFIHVPGDIDQVYHLASPASPIDYLRYPIQTLKVNALGTHKALGFCKDKEASFLIASTSEVYGDPQVHPQPETYWGNVNPVGPRGVYDESKRFAESLAMAYRKMHGINTHIARIFNTYGPNMRCDDGRAVPAFISEALEGRPITIHGDGSQTRSFCFVDDTIAGLVSLMNADFHDPVNIGNPAEMTINELAGRIVKMIGSSSEITNEDRPVDDPQVREPDISLARKVLGWEPRTGFEDGMGRTIEWFRNNLSR